MNLIEELKNYKAYNAQEEADLKLFLKCLEEEKDLYSRENTKAHITASAWIINQDGTKILLAYHNLYDSWAWLGGHADGLEDLKALVAKEVEEESGLKEFRFLSDLYSVEVLPVLGHFKKGNYVSGHLHLNVTYLIEADDTLPLQNKPDENQAVAWFNKEDVYKASKETWYIEHIYRKLNERIREYK